MVGVCALAMLGGCSQDLVMLEPASNKLATYHVKDMVLHIEGINQSESLQDADKFSSAIEATIYRELQNALRGTKPAGASIRFREVADRETYTWTDKTGLARSDEFLYFSYFVNLAIRDDGTGDVVAEQWFSVDRGDLFSQLDQWLSLSRDEQLKQWSSRLAEKVRMWVGSVEPDSM